MVMKKTVGEKIRAFRQQKKLTQEQLALGAEINPVFLGHLERNLKSPTITKCERKAPKFIYGDISSLKNNDSISLFFIVLYF